MQKDNLNWWIQLSHHDKIVHGGKNKLQHFHILSEKVDW